MEQILNDLNELERNWMHKTQGEKIEEIRLAVLQMCDLNYNKNASNEDNSRACSKINRLLWNFRKEM